MTLGGQTVNVDTGAGLETRTVNVVGTAGAAGTGLTLTVRPGARSCRGVQVNDAVINVDVDPSGGTRRPSTSSPSAPPARPGPA